MASPGNVVSESHLSSPDVASKRGVTWSSGVNVAGGGVNKQASLAHVASGSHVASVNVASKRGVTCPGSPRRGTWRQNVASVAHLHTWRHQIAHRKSLRPRGVLVAFSCKGLEKGYWHVEQLARKIGVDESCSKRVVRGMSSRNLFMPSGTSDARGVLLRQSSRRILSLPSEPICCVLKATALHGCSCGMGRSRRSGCSTGHMVYSFVGRYCIMWCWIVCIISDCIKL